MFFVLPVEEGTPAKKFPFANLLLITLNVYVFFQTYFRFNFEQLVLRYGFIPAHPHFQNVLTSMFLHAGWAHILGNMYFLYVFGDKVEDRLGKGIFLLAYLASGFGACYLQYSVDPHSALPMIGASGAISGICALYMVLFPWQKMRLQFFFLIFPIFSIGTRALFVVGFWFLEQYLTASATPVYMGGVAFWAHVGGFITGILLFPFVYPGKKNRA